MHVDDPEFPEVANSGTLKWVVKLNNELVVGPHSIDGTEISHAFYAGGEDVRAAGQADVAYGEGQYVGLDITRTHLING